MDHPLPVIGIATGNIHYQNWDGTGKVRLLTAVALFKTLTAVYGYLPGDKIGFGLKEAKTLIRDWCHTAMTGNYNYYLKENTISKSKALFISINGDQFAPFRSTQKLAEMFNDYKINCIELNQNLKGNKHSVWLKQPELVVQEIENNLINLY